MNERQRWIVGALMQLGGIIVFSFTAILVGLSAEIRFPLWKGFVIGVMLVIVVAVSILLVDSGQELCKKERRGDAQ